LLGNPVRQDIINISDKKTEAAHYFGLDTNKKTIFLTGGSLGARTLNESVLNHLELFINKEVQIIWQCGKFYYEDIKKLFNEADYPSIRLMPFVSRVDLAYSMSDVIIARAGASTISELCLVKKPTVLVPSPNVTADHQTKNAMALVEKNATVLIKDSAAKDTLMPYVFSLLENNVKQQELSSNIAKLGLKDSAKEIAKEIISLININKK